MKITELIFASHNAHKLEEIRKIFPASIRLIGLEELGFTDEIEETANTFEGNALIKARTIAAKFKLPCFADDSGLEVDTLNKEPGVYSARYAGIPTDHQKNLALVLEKMKGKEDRNARFKTVIALVFNGEEHLFTGQVEGLILAQAKGASGFGYDPIFEPENLGRSFAEMTLEEKNKFSHRARALAKMKSFLVEKKYI